jgi:hypothetical protein
MTLQEAQQFIGKKVRINWGPLDRPARKNETIPMDTITVIKGVFITCHNEVFAVCDEPITCPVDVRRLSLYE